MTGKKSGLSEADQAYLAEMRDGKRRAEERGQFDTWFHTEVARLEALAVAGTTAQKGVKDDDKLD